MKPVARLISHTENPVKTLNAVWQASRDNEPVDLENDSRDLFRLIIESKIPVAEMVDFVFLIEGVSIALREQMVRHRIGAKVGGRIGADIVPDLADSSWWSQSMRILDMGQFHDRGDYDTPQTILDAPEEIQESYQMAMFDAQETYTSLVKAGIPMEDARNVIPLAATHRIVWKLNLAALLHIVGKRGCWILQGGIWQDLILSMVNELATRVDPVFLEMIKPPCISGGRFRECLFKLDNERRIVGEDEIPPCPLYLRNHSPEAVAASSKSSTWRVVSEPGKGPAWGCEDESKVVRAQRMAKEKEESWDINLQALSFVHIKNES